MYKTKQPTLQEQFYNPYSFVPLSNHVFKYGEEEKLQFLFANDVPFSDGLSGNIFVTFKAESPFCVRSEDKRSCNIKGRYFVPSTSIKGMVHSVFDIITLSNIRNFTENSRFSMRDLISKDYELKEVHPKSGFLILLNGKYYIIPCYNWKVSYEDIKIEEGVDVRKGKTVGEKYRMLPNGYVFQTKDNLFHYRFFSGFMSNKHHEYDFALPASINQGNLIPLRDKELKDFLFIHEKENKNKSWIFWKKKIHNFSSMDELKAVGYRGLAPCFYRSEKDEAGIYVKDFGFSFLYRMPYQKKIHDCLPESYKGDTFDMSQALFGYVNPHVKNQKEICLKGRVRFSNAFIENAEQEGEHTFILGSPKPTYYPFYLQQNREKLTTFASDNPIISGWKRYLVHNHVQKGTKLGKGSESSFVALKAGASFTTEIHIHNLHPYEVGALLAALTFCNHKECHHTLGYAKPFGYGKMRMTDLKLDLKPNNSDSYALETDTLMELFYRKVCDNTHISIGEYRSYVRNLIQIASDNYTDYSIRYPRLDNYNPSAGKKKSEFEIIKKLKMSINDFSPIK